MTGNDFGCVRYLEELRATTEVLSHGNRKVEVVVVVVVVVVTAAAAAAAAVVVVTATILAAAAAAASHTRVRSLIFLTVRPKIVLISARLSSVLYHSSIDV
jgi:hypothetical protein